VQAAVLAATEELLGEGASYADLRIERIARRAGISRTAFYFYFRDKRELLMRLTEDVNDLLYAQADIWWSGSGDPAAEMREALTNIAALYDAHGVLLRAIVEVSTYDEEVAVFWRTMMGRFVDATRRRIEREVAAGVIAPGPPPEATAFSLCWMTERVFYERLVAPDAPPRDALVDALCRIWVGGVYASARAAEPVTGAGRPPTRPSPAAG
jgi:TetR/AcrR family transcriptional regulator, ethionamide resistance regulator